MNMSPKRERFNRKAISARGRRDMELCYTSAMKKRAEQIYRFPVVIERDKDGYFAMCPGLQGCYSQGDTYEETLANITGAIRLHVEDRVEENEDMQKSDSISLSTVEVSVPA